MEVIRRSLIFIPLLLAACGSTSPAKPELPESVSPGWKRVSFEPAAAPAVVPATGLKQCWKAAYTGEGTPPATADVSLCLYSAEPGAFDAVQRTRAEAQTVKFQEGAYFVLVSWNGAPKAGLTAFVREIQKTLKPR